MTPTYRLRNEASHDSTEGDCAQEVINQLARQRAEIRRLRAFARGCSTFVCACGDGDICVGCAARQVLAKVKP